MTLKITAGGKTYSFDGPHSEASSLTAESGTYVVSTKNKNGKHRILDVGESAKVKERVDNHDRADCWTKKEKDGLFYSGYYCDEKTRTKLADDIRDQFDPPCGER